MDSSLVSQNRFGENCDMIPFNAIFCKFNNFLQMRHILKEKGIQYIEGLNTYRELLNRLTACS